MKWRASWKVAATTQVSPSRIASRSSCLLSSMSSDFGDRRSGTCPGRAGERRDVLPAVRGGAAGKVQLADGEVGRRARAGPAEQPPLAQRGAERPRHGEVGLGLDALGEDERAGALGVGVDRVHDLARPRARAAPGPAAGRA